MGTSRLSRLAAAMIPLVLGSQLWAQEGSGRSETRPASWKGMIPSIASDQKRIWTFPFRVARGKHLTPFLSVAGVTAGMVAADPHDTPYFRSSGSLRDFNVVFNGRATNYGIAIAPLTLYAAGLIRRDSYQQKTALLAGEAAANATIVTVVLKGATSRLRQAGDLRGAGGPGRAVRHPHPGQRQPAAGHRGIADRPVGRPSHKPVVWHKSFLYQAGSWKTTRRVVAKVEFHFGELFPRVGFIVTNLETDSRAVVRFYNKRGTVEE